MQTALHKILAALAIAFSIPTAYAITPLSPRLSSETRIALLRMLSDVTFPEVGQNSVLIALTGALGFEPKNTNYQYSEPYAHLPQVEVKVNPTSSDCAAIILNAAYVPPAKQLRVKLQATYCLVGTAEWHSNDQVLIREE